MQAVIKIFEHIWRKSSKKFSFISFENDFKSVFPWWCCREVGDPWLANMAQSRVLWQMKNVNFLSSQVNLLFSKVKTFVTICPFQCWMVVFVVWPLYDLENKIWIDRSGCFFILFNLNILRFNLIDKINININCEFCFTEF